MMQYVLVLCVGSYAVRSGHLPSRLQSVIGHSNSCRSYHARH